MEPTPADDTVVVRQTREVDVSQLHRRARRELVRVANANRDPLRAALESIGHEGRVMYVARKLAARPAEPSDTSRRMRALRETFDADRRRELDDRRAAARRAGFRRLSRWAAAGSPLVPPAGRTPVRPIAPSRGRS